MALVVALIGGLIAVDQSRKAVRERHIAVARELAAAADSNIRDDPELSILLALAAVDATRGYDEPVLREALEVLHRGVASTRIVRSFPGVGGTMDWSADGRLFVTEGTEETGIVDIRDAVTGRTVQKFRGDEIDLNDAVFSPDGTRVITASDEGAIRVWDIATGRKVGDLTVGSDGAAWGPSVSPDGSLVAGAWQEAGTVRVFPAHRRRAVDIPRRLPRRHGVQPGRASPRRGLGGFCSVDRRRRQPPRGAQDARKRDPRPGVEPGRPLDRGQRQPRACVRRSHRSAAVRDDGAHQLDQHGRLEPGLAPARHGRRGRHSSGLRRRRGRATGSRPARRTGPAQRCALGRFLARRWPADDQRLGDHLGQGVGRARPGGRGDRQPPR